MRSERLPVGRLWPVLPAATTLLALLAVVVINLAAIMAVVDERARLREEALLLAAVELRLSGLETLVDDNSHRDEAASALRGPTPDVRFFDRHWGPASADAAGYSGVFLVAANGKALRGFIRGRKLPDAELADMSSVVPALRSRLETAGRTMSGLVRFRDAPMLVASGALTPRTPDLLAARATPRWLVMSRRIDSRLVAELNHSIGLSGLRLGPAGPDEAELVLRSAAGDPVVTLAWAPARPGLAAVREQAATVVATLLLSLIVLGIVGRSSVDMARRLTSAALSDALSGLPNRRSFRAQVGRDLLSNRPVCIALLDLDGFKSVNDIYGHAVGDQLLLAAARALHDIAGDGASIARLGGDEFAMATAGEDAARRLEVLVELFIERTRQPFQIDERTLVVGASAGLATGTIAETDAGELLRRADVALYAAKREGKGRSRWYHGDLDRRQAEAHALAEQLRADLAAGAFHMVYQPIVSDAAGSIAGVEALLRHAPRDGPPIPPDRFIPVAEETGLIDRIGLFALRRACEEIRDLDGLHLAVNLSVAQLRNPDLPARIEDVLIETGFPASRLELEVTETYLVSDPDRARAALDRIRALGVTLCLDDFGSGYASMGFLRRYPFDRLKIDRSLVVQATKDPASEAMLQASLALARVLGMTVVAEGIETPAQCAAMLEAGCDLLQGWLFARELSPAEVARRWSEGAEGRASAVLIGPPG